MTATTPVVGFAPYNFDRPEPGMAGGTFVLLVVLGFWALAWFRASFRVVGRWMDRRAR